MGQALSETVDFNIHAEAWARLVDSPTTEADGEAAEIIAEAERRILSMPAVDLAQVIVQLELVSQNLEFGPRTDGLDIAALRGIQKYLMRHDLDGWLNAFLEEREKSSYRRP